MPRKSVGSAVPAGKLTDEHKAALAAGRQAGRAVRRYLQALQSTKPRRGRPPSQERIARRLAEIEQRLEEADVLTRLHLVQERIDLERESSTNAETYDIAPLEAEFVKVAAGYSKSKGLTYEAWRSAGVEPRVLQEAGITRRQ